jgi:hypothetical protein
VEVREGEGVGVGQGKRAPVAVLQAEVAGERGRERVAEAKGEVLRVREWQGENEGVAGRVALGMALREVRGAKRYTQREALRVREGVGKAEEHTEVERGWGRL